MEVVLYSTGCPQCIGLKTILDKNGIQYHVCDDLDVMREKGFLSVPMIEVDGTVMNFRNAVQWANERGTAI